MEEVLERVLVAQAAAVPAQGAVEAEVEVQDPGTNVSVPSAA